jgi:hypothetical protein
VTPHCVSIQLFVGKIPPSPPFTKGGQRRHVQFPLNKRGVRGDFESQWYHDHRRRSSLPRLTERLPHSFSRNFRLRWDRVQNATSDTSAKGKFLGCLLSLIPRFNGENDCSISHFFRKDPFVLTALKLGHDTVCFYILAAFCKGHFPSQRQR